MKAGGEISLAKVACRISPRRTLTALGTAMGLLFLSLGTGSSAQTNVTPAQYLASQPKPYFAPGYHLPHLTRCGYSMLVSTNTALELADHWGYALDVDISNLTLAQLLASPYGQFCMSLVKSNPAKYKLSAAINRAFPTPIPDGFWVTNASGWFVDIQSNTWQYATNTLHTKVESPEAPAAYLQSAATYQVSSMIDLATNCPVTIILNMGETGLGVAAVNFNAWQFDPRIVGKTNGMTWPRYASNQKARELGFVTTAVRQNFPNREFYLYYQTGTEEGRTYPAPPWDAWWGWDADVMVTNTDFPSFESYYQGFASQQWTGNYDLLTKFLNAVGFNLALGYTNYYDWVSGGWYLGATNRSPIPVYTGFLKCCYTAGMVGANGGYYGMPDEGGFDVPFPTNAPVSWLLQFMALSHVHALFSHLENFLTNGDLLSGPQSHALSLDQPAYEFTNTAGYVNDRVLARKLRGQNQWIVTAWAADGTNRNVTVSIPTIGALTVLAANSGSVYQVTMSGTNVQQTLLDEYASFQPAPPVNLRVLPQ